MGRLNRKDIKSDERGQAVTEYILMLAVIIGFVALVSAALKSSGFAGTLVTMLSADYAHAYQYGYAQAKGYEDGGPTNHPRAIQEDSSDSSGNFRIFLINDPGGATGQDESSQ